MLDCLAIGDVTIDHFFFLSHARVQTNRHRSELCLAFADKLPVDGYAHSVAGNAANVAVGARRLGLTTALVASVGDDSGGREIIHKMSKERVETRWIRKRRDERTNIAAVLSFNGERTILVYHAPHRCDVDRLPNASWIYFTSIGPDGSTLTRTHRDILRYLERHSATRCAFNPGTYQLQLGFKRLLPLLRRSTVLFVNKEEAELLLTNNAPSNIPTLLKLFRRYRIANIVITDGPKGAWSIDSTDAIAFLKPFPAREIERTGAGDSFATAVMAGLSHGEPLSAALRWGAANAAGVVEQIGPQAGLLTLNQLKKVLQKYKNIQPKILY